MAFINYIEFDGVEIVNANRTDHYAHQLGLDFFKCDDVCPSLTNALRAMGKMTGSYGTPKEDAANCPWMDTAEPWGAGFAGVHILEEHGFNDSTWEAFSNESLVDGGFVSKGRFRTREMTFRALLMGVDLHAVQHGLNWLSTVLHRGNPCEPETPYPTYRDVFLRWARYKDEASIPADDDVYQAPLVTGHPHDYQGLIDSLVVRIPVSAKSLDELVGCEGSRMNFFVRCPNAGNYKTLQRYFLDVHCTSGPTIITSHEVTGHHHRRHGRSSGDDPFYYDDNPANSGGDGDNNPSGGSGSGSSGSDNDMCVDGAWAEVEFTLVAANPFAYRNSIDLARFSNMMHYSDFLPGADTVAKPWWTVYKDESSIPADDDVYQAPLLFRDLKQTYTGLLEALWRKVAAIPVPPPVTSRATDIPSLKPLTGPIWVDPSCPPPAQFPATPDPSLLCAPHREGPWIRRVYRAGTNVLPKFTEAVLLMELRAWGQTYSDIRVRLVPQNQDFDTGWDVEFYIDHLPDGATMRIDGRRRSIVMYEGFPGAPDFIIGPASHLVTTDNTGSSYRYPTLLCGGRYNVLVDVADTDDPDLLEVRLHAIGREG